MFVCFVYSSSARTRPGASARGGEIKFVVLFCRSILITYHNGLLLIYFKQTTSTQPWSLPFLELTPPPQSRQQCLLSLCLHTHVRADACTQQDNEIPCKILDCATTHLDSLHPFPATPSRRAFKRHKGDYTGAKILRDQLINAIFQGQDLHEQGLNGPLDQHCLLFHTQFDLHMQQQINFCSFHLGNKKANYHSKEQRPLLYRMHIKRIHFSGRGKDRGGCML